MPGTKLFIFTERKNQVEKMDGIIIDLLILYLSKGMIIIPDCSLIQILLSYGTTPETR
jgi:hypothetical protein